MERKAEVRTRGDPKVNSLPSSNSSGTISNNLVSSSMACSKVIITGSNLATTCSSSDEMRNSMDSQYAAGIAPRNATTTHGPKHERATPIQLVQYTAATTGTTNWADVMGMGRV